VDVLWQIVYILLAVYVTFILPYSFFFYESDVDPESLNDESSFFDSQAGEALKYTIFFAIIIIVLLIIMYALLASADIPVHRISYGTSPYTDSTGKITFNPATVTLQPLSTPIVKYFNDSYPGVCPSGTLHNMI